MEAALKVKILCGKNNNNLKFYLKDFSQKKFLSAFTKTPKNLDYYVNLWGKTHTLPQKDKKAVQKALGAEIDLQNILWLYRLKKYYGIYGPKAYGFLVPIRHNITQSTLEALANSTDTPSFKSILSTTVYKNIFTHFNNPEATIKQFVVNKYRNAGGTFSLLCGHMYKQTT